jgi:hypothetical protein
LVLAWAPQQEVGSAAAPIRSHLYVLNSAQSSDPLVHFVFHLHHILFQECSILHQQLPAHVDALQAALPGNKYQGSVRIEDYSEARRIDDQKVGKLAWLQAAQAVRAGPRPKPL